MDELTEVCHGTTTQSTSLLMCLLLLFQEEVTCLRASSRPWYKLPDNCKHDELPLYIKLCTDMNEQKNGLIVLLTDVRSSVWMEYFGESRAIHIRIKVSARETPKSTYTDLKEKEAVAKLFEGLDTYSNTLDADASIESKSESEVNNGYYRSGGERSCHCRSLQREARLTLMYS